MPKITAERRSHQRQRIIDAMLTAIRRQGVAATSMPDVMELSGLSAGAVYRYFAGKDEIFRAAAMQVIQGRSDVLAGLASRSPTPSPGDALKILWDTVAGGALDSGTILQIWGHATTQADLKSVALEVWTELHTQVETYLVAWFTQQKRSEPARDARRAAPVMIALVQGHVVQTALTGQHDTDTFLTGLDSLLTNPAHEPH